MDVAVIHISREITSSDASAIFEVTIDGEKYAMKVYHDDGDPGYSENGRSLNRFRCERNAYKNLSVAGVCERGFVPRFYGVIERVNPTTFKPFLNHFTDNKFHPSAILLEYLPNAESLNYAVQGMKEIHKGGVFHEDIYPKNLLLVRDDTRPKTTRLVWIDFDVSTTFMEFGEKERSDCEFKIKLVKEFGEALEWEGLPPNTKYY
ncbi:hypothetical protein BDW74DRAFT_164419 [Aspergillus multicolor]|uniref:uncharacterized protein n=1 Tax=Aspergillus multicolor TaxID=41759 RepID=UPI003CCE516F